MARFTLKAKSTTSYSTVDSQVQQSIHRDAGGHDTNTSQVDSVGVY
jgi:hypothetical protein